MSQGPRRRPRGPDEELLPQSDDGTERSQTFLTQLTEHQSEATVHGVIAVLGAWVGLGGRLEYGKAGETTCFIVLGTPHRETWPAAIYPSGKFEVVFQYLKDRPPFDELANRRKLRELLNTADGVDLPEGKLALRPGFPLEVLAAPPACERVTEALAWFVTTQRDSDRDAINEG